MLATPLWAELPQPSRLVTYKTVGPTELKLHVFEPAQLGPDNPRAAIVFFFGGGWQNGSPEQFYPQCADLAKRGLVAISADYRTASRHQVSPRECVADAKSCLRWVRAHARELQVDPTRLAAGGGSAGGHLAIAAVLLPGYNEPGEDTSVPCEVQALVLFNPVIDNGPGGYGYDRTQAYYREFSPAHNLRRGLPPVLLMFGTEDKFVPVKTAESFRRDMENLGNRCDLHFYPGQAHGFFNFKDGANPYYAETMKVTGDFLGSLGLLAR